MNPKCETCKGHGRLTGACMGGLVDYECHECNGSGKQPTPTTDTQRLRELLAAATPGPWSCEPRSITESDIIKSGKDSIEVAANSEENFLGWYVTGPQWAGRGDYSGKDAACIAALRNEAPALLDEVERLRHQLKKPRSCDTDEINELKAERDKLREEVERLREQVKKPRSCDTDEIIRLSNEVAHWRANAKNQAEIRRAIATRPDLKECAPYVEKIAAERDKLREEAASLRSKFYIEAENLTATLRELNASREEVERLQKDREGWFEAAQQHLKDHTEAARERDSLRRENEELKAKLK